MAPRACQLHKKVCSICTNCRDVRITVEYTLNTSDCVSAACELCVCYQSFDQYSCIQTNPVVVQLHVDTAYT